MSIQGSQRLKNFPFEKKTEVKNPIQILETDPEWESAFDYLNGKPPTKDRLPSSFRENQTFSFSP